MGSLYQRGRIWWIKYHRGCKTFRESTGTDDERKAQKVLDLRLAQVKTGTLPSQFLERIRFEELAEDYLNDYRMNGKKSLCKAEECVKQLTEHFAGYLVTNLTTSVIKEYIAIRQDQKKKNGTINRHLSALRRMLNLGARHEPPKVSRVPHIPMLAERNVRTGFFEHDEFLSLRGKLPDYLKPVVTLAYYTGCRRGEILGLRWEQVDLDGRRIRLNPGETKNDDGRVIYMTDDLHRVLTAWHRIRTEKAPNWPLVCFRLETGQPVSVGDFRKAWNTACQEIGLEGRLFHDFRRTACRNLVRAGVPERVAMRISGHQTRSVFDRYNITSEADLKDAAGKLDAFHGHNLGTIGSETGAPTQVNDLQPTEK
jgi:integrase